MESKWKKLKNMKECMKSLNTKEFSNVESKIFSIKKQLEDTREELRDQYHDAVLYDKENELKADLEKRIMVRRVY